jgi:hypothetical protein
MRLYENVIIANKNAWLCIMKQGKVVNCQKTYQIKCVTYGIECYNIG